MHCFLERTKILGSLEANKAGSSEQGRKHRSGLVLVLLEVNISCTLFYKKMQSFHEYEFL